MKTINLNTNAPDFSFSFFCFIQTSKLGDYLYFNEAQRRKLKNIKNFDNPFMIADYYGVKHFNYYFYSPFERKFNKVVERGEFSTSGKTALKWAKEKCGELISSGLYNLRIPMYPEIIPILPKVIHGSVVGILPVGTTANVNYVCLD